MKKFKNVLDGEVIVYTSPDIVRSVFEEVKDRVKRAVEAGYDTSRIYLMLDEVISNVYRHGYKQEQNQPIGVRVRIQDQFCYVAVRDLAPSFDSAAHASTRSLPDVHSGRPGGMGLIIVNSMCESYRHQVPREGGNLQYLVLKLSKRRENQSSNNKSGLRVVVDPSE